MSEKYHIDQNLDVPIYRQLSDKIAADIRNGEMLFGERLPTVQELSARLSLARGTVKRCYDELEKDGLIEKVQGRGTFVSLKSDGPVSRKEAAMTAIDEMLNTLERLDFSDTETNIFINLKLREREKKSKVLKAATVASCPELLLQLTSRMRDVEGAEVFPYLAGDVLKYPYGVSEDSDVIIVQADVFERIYAAVPDKNKLLPAALAPDAATLRAAGALSGEGTAVIASDSEEFSDAVKKVCAALFPGLRLFRSDLASAARTVGKYGSRVVVAADAFERFCSRETEESIRALEKEVKIIRMSFAPDEGSRIYINDRIQTLLRKKTDMGGRSDEI